MKEVDMLKSLEGFLISLDSRIEPLPYPDKAKAVLDFMEDAGMLPPPVGVGEEDDWGYFSYEYYWEGNDENL